MQWLALIEGAVGERNGWLESQRISFVLAASVCDLQLLLQALQHLTNLESLNLSDTMAGVSHLCGCVCGNSKMHKK